MRTQRSRGACAFEKEIDLHKGTRPSLSSQRQSFPSTYIYLSTDAILSTKGRLGEGGGEESVSKPHLSSLCLSPAINRFQIETRADEKRRETLSSSLSLSLFNPASSPFSLGSQSPLWTFPLPLFPSPLSPPLMAPLYTKVLKDQGEHKHIVAAAFLLYPSSSCYLSP